MSRGITSGFIRRGLTFLAALAVPAAAWFAWFDAGAGEGLSIRFATLAPEGTSWMNSMHQAAGEVDKSTGGAVKFIFYAGGSQGDEREMFAKMAAGQIHAGGFSGNGMQTGVPAVRVLDLPLVFNDSAEVDAAQQALFDDMAAAFDRQGYVLLGFVDFGFVYFFTPQPIRAMADLARTKMAAWAGDELASNVLKEFKVSPHSIAVPDMLSSLRTGLIDSFYSSPYGAVAMQWHEQVKAVSGLKIVNPTGGILIRKDIFNALKPEHRQILKDVMRRTAAALSLQIRKENDDALKLLKKSGLTLTRPPEGAELKKFTDAAERMRTKMLAEGRFFDKAALDKLLDAIKKKRGGR